MRLLSVFLSCCLCPPACLNVYLPVCVHLDLCVRMTAWVRVSVRGCARNQGGSAAGKGKPTGDALMRPHSGDTVA